MSAANVDQPEERRPRRRAPRPPVEPATAPVAGSTEAEAPPVDLDDRRPPRGLGDNETIDRTYHFDGDIYHRVRGSKPGVSDWFRMVQRQNKRDEESGQIIVTLVPIFDGALVCRERAVHVAIEPRTRTLKSEVTDESFLFQYKDNRGNPIRSTVITDTELLEVRKLNWMTRLGLSTIVRAKKYPAVRELLRAVAFNARKEGEATVRIIDQTGPVYIDGRLCYANATGYIGPDGQAVDGMGYVFSPDGPVSGVRCRPGSNTEQYRDIEYPVALPETQAAKLSGLRALSDLLTGYTNPGLTGVLVGQLLAAPLTGTLVRGGLPVSSVSSIIGPTRSGKTAYDMLLFTSQTRSIYGEVNPAISARCAPPGGSGGTTPAGIWQALATFGGVRSLLDDVLKDQWSEQHQRKAHDTVYERTVTAIVGGGAVQAQGDGAGKVEAAKSKRLYQSACFSAECVGHVANLLEDSTYNRVALVWWDKELRCSQANYDRMKSREHTLLRNDGMRVVLDVLLRNPDTFADGYDIALTALREADLDERVAKNYARCLAGLHVLDMAYRENGQATDYLAQALDPAIEIAQRLEAYGSNGGDQKARTDIAEATREALSFLLDDTKAVYIADPPEKMPKGTPAVPTEPTQYPFGFGPSDCGWYPDGASFKPKSAAVLIGALIEKLPGSGGRPHPFPYRVEMKSSEFDSLHRKLNYASSQLGYRECSREERVAALITAGTMREALNANKTKVYQLDYLWIRSTTFEDVVKAEADDAKAEGGE